MSYIFIYLFIFFSTWTEEVQKLYENGKYQESLRILRENETENMGLNFFNQAQNLRRIDSLDSAILMYQKSLSQLDKQNKSIALNNIAVILAKKGNTLEAIETLKQALREDFDNLIARRNYEILYKKPKKNPPPPKPDFFNPPPQNAEKNLDTSQVNFPQITENEIEEKLVELKNRPLKYIQQIKKYVKSKPNGPH